MKRYLIALPLLLIVACVGLFAFKGVDNAAVEKYYFFEVVNDQVNPDGPLNPSPMTKEEFLASGIYVCPEGDRYDCVRGWKKVADASVTGAGLTTILRD